MPLPTTRRSAVLAGLAALAPFAAEAGKRKKRRRKRRRCPEPYESRYDIPGAKEYPCATSCETVAECPPGVNVGCIRGRCRYCPSEQWELAWEPPGGYGATRCTREGFSVLRAACAPW